MSKKMSEVCGKNPAEVPDRERMGRPINRICRECHTKRLKEDMERSLELQRRRRRNSNPNIY